MDFIFPPSPPSVIHIRDSELYFPVRRIFCVGRNYAAHAREMGHDPEREPPFFFCKPADAILPVTDGETGVMPYPPATHNLHHEVELVVALGSGGANLSLDAARASILGYAIGLDMTRRDLQNAAKAKGHPWDTGKAFDSSAPISTLVRASQCPPINSGRISLRVNEAVRQTGDLADMTWRVPEIIVHLSTLFMLRAGDLIFTGTPEGVAAVEIGDVLEAEIEHLGQLKVRISGGIE